MSYEQFDHGEFVNRLAGLGFDQPVAERLAREHEAGNTARYGVPEGGWRFDDYDVAEVERHAAPVGPVDLARAMAQVVEDYRAEEPEATPEEAIAHTRADLDLADIDNLAGDRPNGGPAMDAELAAAYREVLNAPQEAFTPDMASRAAGALARREQDQGGDSEGDPAEVVTVVDDCDASVACAAAAAAAAEAARRARAAGDDGAVGVVVVEDLAAACDEEGGF